MTAGRIAPLDARLSRPLEGGPSFPLRHRLFRAGWIVAWTLLARWTPPPLHAWRRLVLRLFGARLAPAARVYASARVWYPPEPRHGPAQLARAARHLLLPWTA